MLVLATPETSRDPRTLVGRGVAVLVVMGFGMALWCLQVLCIPNRPAAACGIVIPSMSFAWAPGGRSREGL